MRAPQNIRAFRHEVHAAEYDVAPRSLGRLIRQLQRITAKIGEFHNLVALVMMSQNHNIVAQARLCGGNALV